MATATSPVLCVFQLSPNSDKDYTIDVSKHLQDSTGTVVDSVAAVNWLVDPNTDIQLHTPSVSGTKITIWAKTVSASQAYRVTARVTTASTPPRIFEEVILLAGIEKAGDSAVSVATWPP